MMENTENPTVSIFIRDRGCRGPLWTSVLPFLKISHPLDSILTLTFSQVVTGNTGGLGSPDHNLLPSLDVIANFDPFKLFIGC